MRKRLRRRSCTSLHILAVGMIAYYILDLAFPYGQKETDSYRIFPQAVMAIICISCLVMTIGNLRTIRKYSFTKPFLCYATLALLYVPYPCWGESNLHDNIIFFLKSYIAIFVIFTFIVFYKRDEKKTNRVAHIIFFVQVIYVMVKLLVDKHNSLIEEEELFDSNAGFMLVCCIPFSLTIRHRRLRLYLYSLLIIACIYSGQRSAALTAIVTVPIAAIYFWKKVKTKDVIILLSALIIIGIPLISSAYDNIVARNQEDMLKDSVGSGRNIFWKIVWNDFWNGDPVYYFIGHGTNTVQFLLDKKYGIAIGAHNGWLDHLYTFGLTGLALYSLTILSLLRNSRKINRHLPHMKHLTLLTFTLLMVKVSTSHGYWDISSIPISLVLSRIFYQYFEVLNRRRRLIRHEKDLVHRDVQLR
ncbi:MAG: O-antigen ligase family protein [Bacteroidaceae bacterium]|nr:O-antigen ligase family protein [Bacteroidaceae bacterium]